MTLFIKNVMKEVEVVTKEEATRIYNILREGKSIYDTQMEADVLSWKVLQVKEEASRIEYEVVKIISESDITDKTTVISNITSSMLDITTVVDDIVKWSDGNPDEAPTWDDFIKSIKG